MHIPDNFLDVRTAVATSAISAAGVGYALHRLKDVYQERSAPLMGVMGACVFAGQMINFPVLAGTSGHLCGGVLAAVVLGPWGGAVTITVVLAVQCLLFGDGGLTALGANVLNLAIIGSAIGYFLYAGLRRFAPGNMGIVFAAVLAAWFSVMLSAIACAFQLAASGTYALQPALAAMLFVHSFIGIGEAAITGLSLAFILRSRPDILFDPGRQTPMRSAGQTFVAGTAIAIVIAVLLSPFASPFPDGLEKVAENPGFTIQDRDEAISGPMPDYEFPGIEHAAVAGSVAGLIGTVVVCAAGVLIGRLAKVSVDASSLNAA